MSTAVRFLLVLVLLGLTAAFNIGLVDVRIEEIRYLLGRITSHEDVTQTLGIAAKYELVKRRMVYGEDDMANYELEAKIAALTSSDRLEEEAVSGRRRALLAPVRMVLNVVRFLSGEEIVNPVGDNKVLRVIEIGYFWERNRKYPEAIKVYNQVLERTDLAPEVKAAVLVHKAFCHSMMSEYEAANGIYERVISMYPNTQAGTLSWKLLDFIQSMQKERESIQERSASTMEKAVQYYRLMDYRNAIKFFSLFLNENQPEALAVEARFFKGRSHEELGESDDAISEYNRVISRDKSLRWARQANRRLLMLGEFYEHKRQMAEEARKQLAAYQDAGFMSEVQRFTALMSESSLRQELLPTQKKQPGAASAVSDSLLRALNQIDLDLTGEKERQREADLEKMREDLIAQGRISPSEIRELDRQRLLKGNPYRRPLAVKEIIDENSTQLKYLYNKRLRAGSKIAGRMEVELKIAANGSIRNARTLRSNLGDAEFEQEVLRRILTWRFKSVPDTLGELTVNYPIEFSKEE